MPEVCNIRSYNCCINESDVHTNTYSRVMMDHYPGRLYAGAIDFSASAGVLYLDRHLRARLLNIAKLSAVSSLRPLASRVYRQLSVHIYVNLCPTLSAQLAEQSTPPPTHYYPTPTPSFPSQELS